MRVFVSYTTKDPAVTDEKLRQVENRLKPLATVFIDKLHNKEGNHTRVYFELWRSDLVLYLDSPQYDSEWVQKELATARKRHKPVIKMSIDEMLIMEPDDIYSLVMDIEKRQWPVWLIMGLSLIACLGVSILGVWLSYRFVSTQATEGADVDIYNARGLFGDSWGGVNAIVSAFAFAGVIVTLFLQNRDLNLQRKEMTRQREEFKKENETLKYQRFESIFYNMLNLQQRIVDGLKIEYNAEESSTVYSSEGGKTDERKRVTKEITGRGVFQYTFESAAFSAETSEGVSLSVSGFRKVLYHVGLKAFDNYWLPTRFDHYFRHLYKILQFVDNQSFSFNEAYTYISFLRGTLSRYELVWIYYNALLPQNNKLKRLIEKYTLLKNIRPEILTRTKEANQYYYGLGLDDKDMASNGFSSGDFEFYLTDSSSEKSKYLLSAFWKKAEMSEGLKRINSWRAYIDSKVDIEAFQSEISTHVGDDGK